MQLLNTSGIVTIGTGDGVSEGEINLNTPGVNNDYGKLLTRAFQRSRHVLQLPGSYTAKTNALLEASRVMIVGMGNPVVNVDATNVGTVASVLAINSNEGVVIQGIEFVTANFVADQAMIAIAPLSGSTALRHMVVGCTFTANNVTAPGFTTSNGTEMEFVKITNGRACSIEANYCFPSIGVTCFKATTGNGNKFKNNEFGNTFNSGLPEISDAQRRAAHRLIDLDREEWDVIADNEAYGIGLVSLAAYQLTEAFFYQGPTSGTEEMGHLTIKNNRLANLMSSTSAYIHVRGLHWGDFSDNFLCFNGVADTAGTGFFLIEGAAGATGFMSRDITVKNNHAHNPGGIATRQCAAVILRNVDGVRVIANDFNEMYCEQAIMADCSAGLRQTLTITVAAADQSITRSAGSYITDGYAVGQTIWVGGLTGNGASFTVQITEVTSATKIKVFGRTLIDEGPTAGMSVNICAVANLVVLANSFKWPAQTPAAKRVPVLRLGTTGEFANFVCEANAIQNSTAAYDGTAAVGIVIPDKGIWNTAALVETASAISVNPRFV